MDDVEFEDVVEIVGVAEKWIPALTKAIINKIGGNKAEVESVAKELMFSPNDLIPVFVEPDIQPYNPADEASSEDEFFRVPLYKFISENIKSIKTQGDGRRHLFILGDAGMGKTSILAMLKLGHIKSLFWKRYDCVALKLGDDTLNKISKIERPSNTLLLLDSLDEDSNSHARVKSRVLDILNATQGFFRVIITCRTQFFPKNEENFSRQDQVKIENYTCPVKYLSLFNDDQVESYLLKKYTDKKKIESARNVISKINDLRFRPLILAYIDDLVDSSVPKNEFEVYSIIVDAWIDRECRKNNVDFNANELYTVCKHIARFMTGRRARAISRADISSQAFAPARYHTNYNDLKNLGFVTVGGRTILNRNSDGDFVFSHKSFQEYLVVLSLEDGMGWAFPEASDMMQKFMLGADLNGKDLRGALLESADLKSISLMNCNLEKSNFVDATLTEANFSGSNLKGSEFRSAELTKGEFRGANLESATFLYATLDEASFVQANIKNSMFSSAFLTDTDFTEADLEKADFEAVKLLRTNFTGSILKNSVFRNAKFENVILDYSDFSGANLSGAKFSNVTLSYTSFENADLTNVKFDNVIFDNVNLKKAKLTGSNIDYKIVNEASAQFSVVNVLRP